MSDTAGAARGTVSPEHARRNALIQGGIGLVLLVVIFGVLLPQFISYSEVWDALAALTLGQFLVVLALGLVLLWFSGAIYTSLIPGLGWWRGTKAWLASTTASFVLPPPLDIPIRFAVYRHQGVGGESTAAGLVLSWFFTSGIKFVLPVVAFVSIVLQGGAGQNGGVIAVIAVAAIIGAALLIVVVLRAKRIAYALGAWSGRIYNHALASHFHLPEIPDMGRHVLEFRERMVATLGDRWRRTLVLGLTAQLLSFVLLLVSLRFVGVTSSQVDVQLAWEAFAAGLLLSMVPFLPGGLGAVELGYVTIMAGSDEALASQVAAAAFLARLFGWLLPIVVGIVPLMGWQRSNTRVEA